MANNWLNFWKEKNAFDDLMVINYAHFLTKVEEYIKPCSESIVLDIGSGPGNLEDAWYNRVKEIYGLDISERYNRIAREKHKEHGNVFFYHLHEDDYVNLSILQNKKFDIIIVMSVLQYYRSKEEVIQLLENIKKHTAPKAQLLLADLMVKDSFLKEIVQVLSEAIREGNFFTILSLFFKLRFSRYYKVRKEAGFLVLSTNEWLEIINKLKLNAKFVEKPLTLQKNRKSLLIQF